MGRVEEIWIYPVRSLAGVSVPVAEVAATGLAGDRARTAVDADGRAVRAKDAPAIREVVATGDRDVDAAALAAVLGAPVGLVDTAPGAPGVAPVHLVSRGARTRAADGDVPAGCSADDPRANLVLDLPEDDERSWVGRTVRIGGAELTITRTPKHCLGVYADVTAPGRVTVGDAVLLDVRSQEQAAH
ncbi:MAG: hypothetical protein JWR82_1293 [Blastococcus sp.]|nr:hypothetical protein [Blastococcus sp.]